MARPKQNRLPGSLLQIYLPDDLKEWLRDYSQRQHLNMRAVVLFAIESMRRREEQKTDEESAADLADAILP